jgi:hypothetical protein
MSDEHRDDPYEHVDYLRDDLLLSMRIGLAICLALVAPLIGPALFKMSRFWFDCYEVGSLLILPPVYLAVGAIVYKLRVARLEGSSAPPEFAPVLAKHKFTYYFALWLDSAYQALITLVLSPGGPTELHGTFWECTILFYVPYIILTITSESSLREARRLAGIKASD